MKRFFKWMLGTMTLTVALIALTPAQKAYAQDDYVSYQTFYDDLSPYGQWVYDPQYGNVWVPDVEDDFRPYYTRGRWMNTSYGNMWDSEYPWGWAAFHYGRWTYDPYYGWVWIPGTDWGPAWVNWRTGGGYYGWAPLGPGISISMSFGNYYCPDNWWVFMSPQYLYRNDFHRYWRGAGYNTTIIRQTTIINNTYNNTYVYGPRANEIERVTHQRINVYNVNTQHKPGRPGVSGNNVSVYRPQVRSMSNNRPANLVQGPRAINTRPQAVNNTRPEFRTAVKNRELQPVKQQPVNNRVNAQQANPAIRQQNISRPQPMAPQQQRQGAEQRFDGRANQQPLRQDKNLGQQPADRGFERQQQPARQERNFDRPQQQQRVRQEPMQQQPMRQERNYDRPRQQNNQPLTAPQPQRMEPRQQPQMQPQPQRMESRPQMQRVERQQPMPQQQPRMEAPRQQPRMEAPRQQQAPQRGMREGGRR